MSIATGLAIQAFFNEASPSADTFRTEPNAKGLGLYTMRIRTKTAPSAPFSG